MQVVVHPQAAHGVVDGGVNPHGNLVGVLIGDALVHVEQVVVAIADGLLAQPPNGVGKVKIDPQPGVAYTTAFVAHSFCVP